MIPRAHPLRQRYGLPPPPEGEDCNWEAPVVAYSFSPHKSDKGPWSSAPTVQVWPLASSLARFATLPSRWRVS